MKKIYSDLAILRLKAESLLDKKLLNTDPDLSKVEILGLIHELEVHQVELEMQQQELALEKIKSAKLATEKYNELYDFAPSGFFTLSKVGEILELNLCGSKMLGKERTHLKNSLFGFFVSADTRPIFNLFLAKTFESKTTEICELILSVNGNLPMYVYLTGNITENGEQCLVTGVDITERILAEKAMNVSNEYYRLLFGSSGDAIIFAQEDGTVFSANPEACRILGRSEDEIRNIARAGILDENDPRLESALEERRKTGQFKGELNFLRKDGTSFPVELSTMNFKDSDGNARISIFARDITERKRVEGLIKASEYRFRNLVHDMQVGVILYGPQDEILLSNPKVLELLDLNKDQLLGMTLIDPDWKVIHKDGSPLTGYNHIAQRAIATRQSVVDVVIGVYRPSKDDLVWLLVNAEPRLNADGKVKKVICTFIDITLRKQAENALSQLNEILEERIWNRTAELVQSNEDLKLSEERYRTVADFTYDWEYWINAEGGFNYVSPACERISGFTAQEFINDPGLLTRIIFNADKEIWKGHEKEVHTFKSGEISSEFNFRIMTKNGDLRWICCICQKIFVDGKYFGIRASNRDITEKINAENELLNITIEVEERERNRFSRDLHDGLGPLLSAVKLYFQWLAEINDSEKAKIVTEKGNQYIDNAIQTTREVALGLSSLVLNQSGYVRTLLNYADSINDTQKLNIDFTFNSNDRFGYLLETTLYRITTELINNTIKYASATNAKIVFNYQKEKYLTTLSYIDNGIGFDLANTEKNSKGLGLLNIRKRVNILKGTMRIETSPGKGVKVYIELPVTERSNEIDSKNQVNTASSVKV